MYDVEEYGPVPYVFSANTPMWDLEYADDTIIFGKTATAVERFLGLSEDEAGKYGLKLNKKKCQYIGMDTDHPIKFQDGTEVQKVSVAKYLGVYLSEGGGQHR